MKLRKPQCEAETLQLNALNDPALTVEQKLEALACLNTGLIDRFHAFKREIKQTWILAAVWGVSGLISVLIDLANHFQIVTR